MIEDIKKILDKDIKEIKKDNEFIWYKGECKKVVADNGLDKELER